MNKNRIEELVKQFNKENYADLFGALIVFEQGDNFWNKNLSDSDIAWLEKIYDYYMENDYYTGLINRDLIDYIEDEISEEGDE